MVEATLPHPRPVLVLHAPADESFVRGYLLSALGAGAVDVAGVVGAIEVRDLATVDVAELERALEACGLMIAVISPAFLADPWSRLSELLASGAAVERDLDMIPLVLESCPLPLHIREKVWLDFRFRGEWEQQAQRLRDHLARPAPVEAPLPCPYPGMRPFEAADARYFHGRGREIEAMVALVGAGEREIYVVGPSGSGKSSLIAAGVVPRLAARPGAAELVVRAMRPGDAPVARLAACIEATTADAAAIAAWATRHPDAQLLVVIDQLEEMFTVASVAEQARFAEALRALRAEPRCVLVLAIRADFYAELMQSQLWLDGVRRHVDLPPLRGAALREAIERPARALDVYLERDLVERLLADAAGAPAVLPLMQETLVQLWGRRRRRRLLTVVEYDALGEGGRSGLAVAISSRAERCLSELTGSQVVIARRLLLRLVSFGDGRPNTRRRQTRIQLGSGEAPAELEAVLRHLVAARLLAMDGDRTEDDQVDLCHDVLITAWPAFATWVETRRADELRRRQIQASAEEWLARGRSVSGLLDEGELAAAITWRETDAARELGESAEVTALVAASRDAVTRARTRRRRTIAGVVGGLGVFAVVAGVAAVVARNERDRAETERAKAEIERGKAETERGNAERALGGQYREIGRRDIADGAFQRAIPYLVAARLRGIDDPVMAAMFRIATASRLLIALRHRGSVLAAEFGADGARLVTASVDGTVQLWDAASGEASLPPLVHGEAVRFAAIHPDGAHVLTISGNAAWIWDTAVQPPTAIALRHAGAVNMATFSADGTAILTASNDRTTQLWSTHTGAPIGRAIRHGAEVMAAELSRDASRIVTRSSDGKAAIWDARTGAQIASLWEGNWEVPADAKAHFSSIFSARFSPDGARVVSTSFDNTVRVWDAVTGALVLPPHDARGAEDAVFSPDGARLVTIGRDHGVKIWEVAKAWVAGPVLAHPCQVIQADWSRDGARLLVQGDDKRVRIWDVASASLVAAIDLEAGAANAAFSPDGTRVVTASGDGVARIWRVPTVAPRVIATGAGSYDAVYSRDGARIATTHMNEGVWVWSSAGIFESKLDVSLMGMTVAFDRAGQQLAVTSHDGIAGVGPLRGPLRLFPHPVSGEPPEPPPPNLSLLIRTSPGAFSPDGRRFATTGTRSSARIWDTTSGHPVTPWLRHDHQVRTIRFNGDGSRVVTAGADGTARVWDAVSGVAIGSVLAHPAKTWVLLALFSPDGRHVVTTAGDHQVRLWSADTHQLEATLTGHVATIFAASFSPDGATLVTASEDRTARIWSIATGRLAAPPLEHTGPVVGAAFSPDGARVVTVSDNRAQIWDAQRGAQIGSPFTHAQLVHSALFSPDGSVVLTVAKADHDAPAVQVWDAGLDPGTLEDWLRLARDGSYPGIVETLALPVHAAGQSNAVLSAPRQP